MTRVNRKLLFLTLFTIASQGINAQNGINSPYSRYGYGILSDCSLGFNKAMAGVSQGFRGSQEINTKNPASYSSVDSLTALFDLGMTFQASTYELGGLRQNAKNTLFDYFAFHFRATKRLGITAAVQPVTRVNYSFASSGESVEGAEDLESYTSYTGEGCLRKVILGAGYQLPFHRNLSIGFNAGYLWGDYNHKATTSYSDASAFTMYRQYLADIKTYTLDFAFQYSLALDKKNLNKLTLGGTYTMGHDISNSATRNTSHVTSSQMLTEVVELENSMSLPHSFAIGGTYSYSNKLRVGLDYEMQMWNKAKYPTFEDYIDYDEDNTYNPSIGTLNNMSKINLGCDYTPNIYSRNFFNRVSYKLGGYYSRSYANADETGTLTDKPYEFGLTAGFTIPLTNRNLFHSTPKINISFAWTQSRIPTRTGTVLNYKDNTLKENYFRLSLGVTLSERWFYKWKVQ